MPARCPPTAPGPLIRHLDPSSALPGLVSPFAVLRPQCVPQQVSTDFVLDIVVYSFCMFATRQPTFTDLDVVLGPVVRRTADDPTKLALAVITRGLDAGVRPSTIRSYSSSRLTSNPSALALVTSNTSWSKLLTSSQTHLRRLSLPAGRGVVAVATSRRLIGRLTSPLPPTSSATPATSAGHPTPAISPRLETSLRYLTAVIGVGIIRDVKAKPGDPGATASAGFDAVALVSASRLAVRTGQDRKAVSRQLTLAAGPAGMLSVVSAAPGNSSRYRLRQLGPAGRESVEDLYDAVGLLAGIPVADLALQPPVDEAQNGLFEAPVLPFDPGVVPEPELAVELLQNAAHPGFSYDLGGPVFLTGFFDALDIDPTPLGLSKRTAAAARKPLAELGLVRGCAPSAVRAILDARAVASGAFARARDAEAARAAAAAVRTEAVLTARKSRTAAAPAIKKVLGKMLTVAGPVPADPAAAGTWVRGMRHLYGQAGVPDTLHEAVRAQLRAKLLAAGWDTPRARTAALRIAAKPAA
jgi:hypothetical protein